MSDRLPIPGGEIERIEDDSPAGGTIMSYLLRLKGRRDQYLDVEDEGEIIWNQAEELKTLRALIEVSEKCHEDTMRDAGIVTQEYVTLLKTLRAHNALLREVATEVGKVPSLQLLRPVYRAISAAREAGALEQTT